MQVLSPRSVVVQTSGVGGGVHHDPARISALSNLPAPTTGQELQQFVCALNWMRSSLPAFNKLIGPLVKMMEKVYERAGGRKKTQVRKVTFSDVGWGEAEVASLENCKQSLQNALQIAHPGPEKLLSVFTDASDEHWGAAITQIPRDQAARPLSKQEHQPLMMLSGLFSGAAKRWTIVEKEAYAIVETCRRADFSFIDSMALLFLLITGICVSSLILTVFQTRCPSIRRTNSTVVTLANGLSV
ncbi:unnamed protein product [Phytophthora lilii]|uniref:Unnamed protein product n=1 Tax=Phytophthora lilii TaxID=2077276 RepID=A0A9W6TC84_9STRA|nr:unnamed protein product [Phytophthora lilii]